MRDEVNGARVGTRAPTGVPEKPGLEGLEARWSQRWERRRHLRVRPLGHPPAGVLDRHAAPDGVRLAPHRARVLLHPHRHGRPLPPDARQGGLLSDGLGRQRPADRAPGPELLRSPLRSRAPLRPGLRAAGATAQGAALDLAPQLRRALPTPDRGGRAGLRAPLAHARALGRLVPHLRDHLRPQAAAGLPARLPPDGPPGRARPAHRPHPLGRRLPDRGVAGRAGGPRTAGCLPPARASRGPEARVRSRSRPPGRSCSPPASPSSPTRTTTRYAPLFGTRGAHPAVSGAGPGRGPPARRAREGDRASP